MNRPVRGLEEGKGWLMRSQVYLCADMSFRFSNPNYQGIQLQMTRTVATPFDWQIAELNQ